jgi:endoglucanase
MKQFLLFLFCLTPIFLNAQEAQHRFRFLHGGIVRGDSTKKQLALVFTADEYGEGLSSIIQTLQQQNVKGSFFFTGRFYRNLEFKQAIKTLQQQGHYLGPHSDGHLLYCDWEISATTCRQ